MIFIETKGHFLMKVTLEISCGHSSYMVHILKLFSTYYKDVIFFDAQKLEAKERDLQYREI